MYTWTSLWRRISLAEKKNLDQVGRAELAESQAYTNVHDLANVDLAKLQERVRPAPFNCNCDDL